MESKGQELKQSTDRMTAEDAIRVLQSNRPPTGCEVLCEAFEMALSALHEQRLAEQAAAVPDGIQMVEITRVMLVKVKTVTKMTRRQYIEGAITDREAAELFEKYLPEEWGVDSVKMLDMTDTIQEVQESNERMLWKL